MKREKMQVTHLRRSLAIALISVALLLSACSSMPPLLIDGRETGSPGAPAISAPVSTSTSAPEQTVQQPTQTPVPAASAESTQLPASATFEPTAVTAPIPTAPVEPSAMAVATVLAAAAVSAEPGMIRPDQVSLDTQGLPYSWQANLVAETPYDASQPPGPTGLPQHIEINFGAADPADWQPGDPIMYLIPVDAYRALWDEAENPSVSSAIDKIYSWTVALQSPPPTSGLPALPPEIVIGFNDLAAQIGRAAGDSLSASRSGYRFVGRWAQDANPVTAESRLWYTYQGFTNDGKYLVSFFYPITAPALPALESLTAEQWDAFNADPQAFIAAQAEDLNALTPDAWEPDLGRLDSLVGSLQIEDMALTGLQSAIWQWTSSTYQGKENPVANPERYEVTYLPGGALVVLADCNRAAGNYSHEGGAVGSVRVQMGPTTLAACGLDSRSQELISGLMAAQDYRVQPGGAELRLNLPAGGPVLAFRAAGPAGGAAAAAASSATSKPIAVATTLGSPAPSPIALPASTAPPPATPTLAPPSRTAPTPTAAPTHAAPTAAPTATRAPTRPVPTSVPTPTPIPQPTADPHLIVITEADIAQAIVGGAAAQQGVTAQNLQVDFADGKLRITADSLGYGFIQLRNFDLVGRLVAMNGQLGIEVESISPRGLASNMVPGVANQALAQFGSKWYVEEINTLDGRVEVRIR